MCVDSSFRGDTKKDKFIDQLNFKNCMVFKRKTTIKLFVGITYKNRQFIINPEYFDANNIFSHPFIYNLKHKPNIVKYLSKQMNKSLKNRYWRTVLNRKYTKYNV